MTFSNSTFSPQSRRIAYVAGGAGFLGSHLCDRLLAEGYAVIAADNLVTGDTANIAHLCGNPAFTYVNIDVADPDAVASSDAVLPSGARLDIVFHFASPAS